jgi:excisionase family DNA binding protein
MSVPRRRHLRPVMVNRLLVLIASLIRCHLAPPRIRNITATYDRKGARGIPTAFHFTKIRSTGNEQSSEGHSMNHGALHVIDARPAPADDEFPMTVREAAKFLGVSRQTVYLWVERRAIPHFRVMGRNIRFLKSDLVSFRASFRQEMENA